MPLALLVLSAFKALGKYVAFSTAEFGVTSLRVIVKRGLFTLRSTEILIPRIESLQIEQPLLGRIFGYGSVYIVGTGGTREEFHMVEAPYELRNQVQAQLTGSSPKPPDPKPTEL